MRSSGNCKDSKRLSGPPAKRSALYNEKTQFCWGQQFSKIFCTLLFLLYAQVNMIAILFINEPVITTYFFLLYYSQLVDACNTRNTPRALSTLTLTSYLRSLFLGVSFVRLMYFLSWTASNFASIKARITCKVSNENIFTFENVMKYQWTEPHNHSCGEL